MKLNTELGFGFCVCEKCYEKEFERKRESEKE